MFHYSPIFKNKLLTNCFILCVCGIPILFIFKWYLYRLVVIPKIIIVEKEMLKITWKDMWMICGNEMKCE